ncbi:hypothetical protein CRUP_019359 [Coryphaenoides rupestris]|nr:hypothetical protein CRUP_019359 [Coryphaenoides rupestris]
MPLNCSIRPNSKQVPYVLEVAKIFQHVSPKPRTIAMSVINKSTKNRLQSIDRREIEALGQKLSFLHKRMQLERSADQSTVVVDQL